MQFTAVHEEGVELGLDGNIIEGWAVQYYTAKETDQSSELTRADLVIVILPSPLVQEVKHFRLRSYLVARWMLVLLRVSGCNHIWLCTTVIILLLNIFELSQFCCERCSLQVYKHIWLYDRVWFSHEVFESKYALFITIYLLLLQAYTAFSGCM